MLSTLQKQVKKLPNEIQHIIISYTYQPQSKQLLEDVHNFTQSIHIIEDFINQLDIKNHLYFISVKEITNELLNFIYFYLSKGILINLDYCFFTRIFMYKNKNIDNFFYLINQKYSLESQIRILWGLLYTHERNEFINYITDLHYYDDLPELIEEEEEDYDY